MPANFRPHFSPGRSYFAVCSVCEDTDVILAEGRILLESTATGPEGKTGIVHAQTAVSCPICSTYHSVPMFFSTTLEANRAAPGISHETRLGPLPTGPRIVAINLLEFEVEMGE